MDKRFKNKILLVDDDAKNLQVAMSILKEYNVIYAQSGQKALELAKNDNFDLILLDIVMPGVDGYDVCKELKQNSKTKDIPVIFLTVKDDEKDIVKGFECGAVDYIVKPFFPEVLLKRVHLHLHLANTMGELKRVNTNLNDIVEEQIEYIREKDQILHQQLKISALSDMVDIVSIQWKKPLSLVKLYLQSLEYTSLNEDQKGILSNSLVEVLKLEDLMYDFQRFFRNDIEKQKVNLKVLIDNISIMLKENMIKKSVNIEISGNNLIELLIVYEEIKHIFIRLINHSIDSFKTTSDRKNSIKVKFSEDEKNVYIKYKDNSENKEEQERLKNLFKLNSTVKNDSFDLGLYLIKLFIEKNRGVLKYEEDDSSSILIMFEK